MFMTVLAEYKGILDSPLFLTGFCPFHHSKFLPGFHYGEMAQSKSKLPRVTTPPLKSSRDLFLSKLLLSRQGSIEHCKQCKYF